MLEGMIVILGGAGSAVLPYVAYQYAIYKNKIRRKDAIDRPRFLWRVMAAALFGTVFAGAALYCMPLWKAAFSILFCWFAIFGICVDHYIRIIGNEMLLALLVLGACYRFLDGGLHSFLGSLAALGIVVALFAAAAGLTFLHKGSGGVGMGDVKLAMVIAITVGWPGVVYFLGGMACAMFLYVAYLCIVNRLFFHSSFPMCAPLMIGFLASLFQPQINALLELML